MAPLGRQIACAREMSEAGGDHAALPFRQGHRQSPVKNVIRAQVRLMAATRCQWIKPSLPRK